MLSPRLAPPPGLAARRHSPLTEISSMHRRIALFSLVFLAGACQATDPNPGVPLTTNAPAVQAALVAPTLFSPKDGATLKWREKVTFDWNDQSGVYCYEIVVNGKPDFTGTNWYIGCVPSSQLFLSTPGFGGRGVRMWWRVRAWDQAQVKGPWSVVRTFLPK
jgi:hypothetical protein